MSPVEGERWHPRVIQLSALLSQGIDRFWNEVEKFNALQEANGHFASRRRHQALDWMWERIDAGLRQAFRHDPAVRGLLPKIIKQVEQGKLASSTAARHLLEAHKHMDAGSSPA